MPSHHTLTARALGQEHAGTALSVETCYKSRVVFSSWQTARRNWERVPCSGLQHEGSLGQGQGDTGHIGSSRDGDSSQAETVKDGIRL